MIISIYLKIVTIIQLIHIFSAQGIHPKLKFQNIKKIYLIDSVD